MATVVCSTGTGVSSYVVHASFSISPDPYPSGATVTTSGKTLANVTNNSTVTVRASETNCSNGYSFPVNVYRSTNGTSWTYVDYLQSGSVSINAGSGTVYLRVGPATRSTSITYYLRYSANGGSGAPSTQTYGPATDATHTFTVSNTAPTRSGYTFMGWAVSSTATTATYYGGDNFGLRSDNPDRTLYAVWRQNPTYRYQLSYSNGSAVLFTDDYSTTASTHSFTVTSTVPTKSGYRFLGWAVSSTATSATYHAGDSFGVRSDNPSATLYAVWQKITISKFYWAGSDSADSNIIATGQPVTNLTAARWNNLLAKIAELSAAQGGSFSYTSVSSGETITAAKFNEARSGIAVLTGHGTLPLIQYSGNEIKASLFNGNTSLKSALNTAIEGYNNG